MNLVTFNLFGTNPFLNLATEEYFLSYASKEEANIYIFFYKNSNSVILGKSLHIEQELFLHKKSPPVIKRGSGGGTVVHFHGNMNYGIILNTKYYNEFYNISNSYKQILTIIINSLPNKYKYSIKGISDIVINYQNKLLKISGNSQQRKGAWMLHHGTLIFNSKYQKKISYYLQQPQKQPEYRSNRNHASFLSKNILLKTPELIQKNILNNFAKAFHLHLCLKNIDSYKSGNDFYEFKNTYIKNRLQKIKK